MVCRRMVRWMACCRGIVLSFAALAAFAPVAHSAQTNLVVNGGFEEKQDVVQRSFQLFHWQASSPFVLILTGQMM